MNKNRATKSLSILLAMCMLLGMLPMTALADNFSDIKGHWAESQINEMINEGIVKGYPDGSFKPDGDISRAEFVSLIVKAFKLTKAKGKDFDDISNHWAKDAILTANAHGIVNGYSDTKFGPDDPITREQMAVIIVKVAHLTDNSKGKTFVDSQDISEWAKKAVAIASSNQLITGYPDNTFKPSGNASRAEATAVLSKSLTIVNLPVEIDYSSIENSGKYGPETGNEIIESDVIIKAKDVILQNLIIKGDLIISKEVGDGDATLNNVKVEGKTYIRGGGIDSIHINGGEYREIIIERTITGAARILTANVQRISITISENDNGEDVILNGEIKTVTIKADGIKVISQGETTIDKIEVTRGLKDVKIELTEDTEVKEIILDSKVDVKGKGKIDKASGSKIRESIFERAPKRIITPSTGGNGSSSSGGTSTTPTIKVSAISITTPPTKTEYEIGEAIDLAGLVVTATYSDNSSKTVTITSGMISGFDSSAAAVGQVVTVIYEGKIATFNVTIKEGVTLPVNKTALTTAISEAETNRDSVEVSENGADVEPSKQWVTSAVKRAYATAITDAQIVADKADATQAEVDGAVATLATATGTFNDAKKAGTKADSVNKTALTTAISEAETNRDSVEVSTDGKDVEPSKQWVTSEVKSAYATAITDARAVADNADATQAEVDGAVATLATATGTFNDAKAAGTKPATIDKYAVTFSVVGGNGSIKAKVDATEISSGAEVEKGSNIVFTATPDTNYKIKEWKVDGTAISETSNSYTVSDLAKKTEVTIEFETIAETFTVTFMSGGANGDMDPVEVVKGEKYTLPEHSFTALQHKKFDHWKVENSDTKYEPGDEIEITGDIWIYANWVTIPIEIWDAPAKVLPGHVSSIIIFINGIVQDGTGIETKVNFTITGVNSSDTKISKSGYLEVGSDETEGQFILRATKIDNEDVYDEVIIKVVTSNALTISKNDFTTVGEKETVLNDQGYYWNKDNQTLEIKNLEIEKIGQGIVFKEFEHKGDVTLFLHGENKINIEAGDLTQVTGISSDNNNPNLIIAGEGSLEITMPDLDSVEKSYGIIMSSLTVEGSASLKITNVKAKDARGIYTSSYTTFKDNAKVEVESYGWVIDAHGGMNPKISIEGNAEFKGTAQGVDPIFLTTDGINIEKGTTVELVRPNFTDTTGKPKFFDYGKDKTLNLAPELKLQGSESEDGSGLVDAKLSGDKPEKVVRKSDDKDVFKYVLIKAGEVTQYDVNVAYVVGGTAEVSVDKDKAKAAAGETVTVSVANIESGKQFKSITIIDADNGTVATTEVTAGESYTFAMPAKNVTVTVTVEEEIEKTVTVGEMQGGSIYAGVSATSKTYNVITTGIADGKYATVKWYGDINKTDNGNTAPAGISIASVNNSPVQDNKIELKVTVQNAANTVQGNYFFTVTIDEVESEVKTFTIEKTNLIDTVTINGLSVPVVGETPYDKNNLSVPENAGYVIDAVSWYDHTKADNNGSGWGVEEFEQGHKYQININLKLEDGYQFASNKNYVLDELDANSYEKVQWGAVGDAQLSIIFKELE